MNQSKVMANKHAESPLFGTCRDALEQAEDYSYLGQGVCTDPDYEKEIPRRIGSGWGALGHGRDSANTNN